MDTQYRRLTSFIVAFFSLTPPLIVLLNRMGSWKEPEDSVQGGGAG